MQEYRSRVEVKGTQQVRSEVAAEASEFSASFIVDECEFKSLLLHLQSGFGSVSKLQGFVCEGVLTIALA